MECAYENNAYARPSKPSLTKKPKWSRLHIATFSLAVIALVISAVSLTLVFVFRDSTKTEQEKSIDETGNQKNINDVLNKLDMFGKQLEELKHSYSEYADATLALESEFNDSKELIETEMSDIRHTLTEQDGRTMSSINRVNETVNQYHMEASALETRLNESMEEVHSLREVQSSQNKRIDEAETEMSDIRLSLTEQDGRMMSSINRVNETVNQYHMKDTPISCPASYVRNPHTNTCIRRITQGKAWEDARNYCEINGEYLATFKTLDSVFWFINLRKTNSVWKSSDHIWIGAKSEGGIWKWKGKTSELADTLYWANEEPNHGYELCVTSYSKTGYTLHDSTCSNRFYFVCEKLG